MTKKRKRITLMHITTDVLIYLNDIIACFSQMYRYFAINSLHVVMIITQKISKCIINCLNILNS